MSDGTKIEWTDSTWNVVNGCSVVSPGCANCYAMRLAGTRMRHHPSRAGLTTPSKAGPVWNGTVRFNDKALLDPLLWKRPRKIFVCAHGDLFHDSVPDEWIDRVFAVMALAPRHSFQLLTKRPERMRAYCTAGVGRLAEVILRLRRDRGDLVVVGPLPHLRPGARWWPLANVWLGVSVEDQKRADERIPVLLDTPAAVRWLSCEPLLGPVDLEAWLPSDPLVVDDTCDLCGERHHGRCDAAGIDWVVAGGESGPGARPMHPDWARSLRDQCAAAGVPFLFKQWGDWVPAESQNGTALAGEFPAMRVGKKAAGRLLDGVRHDGYPE